MLNKLELPAASHSSGASGRDRKIFFASVIFLLAMGSITRFFNLGVGALVGDEMITYLRSAERLWSLINPLYYWLVELARLAFDTPELVARFPSAVISAVSIPVFFLLWRRVIGNGAAFIGAIILVVFEWHLLQGQYGRFYSGVFLFAMVSYYCYWTSLEKGSVAYLLASIGAGFIAFFFHLSALMVLATAFVFSGGLYLTARIGLLKSSRPIEPTTTRVLRIHMLIGVIGACLAIPFVLRFLGGWTSLGEYTGSIVFLRQFLVHFGLVEIVLAAMGWLLLLRLNLRLAIFVLVSAGLPFGLALSGAAIMRVGPTYVFYIAPLLILCAGVLVHEVSQSQSGLVRFGLIAMFPALMLPGFVSHYTDRASLDVREVIEFVEQSITEGDQVMAYPIEFRYYGEGRLPIMSEAVQRGRAREGWADALDTLKDAPGRTWIVFRTVRRPMRPEIERWLLANARLAWRKSAVRLDYSSRGYEVWVVEPRHFDERSYD